MIRSDYIPFGKPSFSRAELEAVLQVMESGWIGMGPQTQAFERELTTYLGARHVVLVNSCTSALFLALRLHGIGPGDEVICPSLTWCSSANAALYLGARVVFCDVDPETMSVTPETVLAKLTGRTRAVVVVHFGGLAADVTALRAALPDGVAIVEDAAHALGARYPDGTMVGSSGNPTCFSFYANKNLSTAEGGAITLADDRAAARLGSLRQHGLPNDAWKRFTHPGVLPAGHLHELGYKMNYTDLQACIGRVQLRRQAEFAETRLAISEIYHERLMDSWPGIRYQAGVTEGRHARHLFLVRLPLREMAWTRDEVLIELRRRNVGASIHYYPLHRMAFYNQPPFGPQPELPCTEQLSQEILTLPISASMTTDDARYVADQLSDVLEDAGRAQPPVRRVA